MGAMLTGGHADLLVAQWPIGRLAASGLQRIGAAIAVARYTTGEVTLTDTPPSEIKRALPDLPKLASELTGIVEAANVIYDEHPSSEEHPDA